MNWWINVNLPGNRDSKGTLEICKPNPYFYDVVFTCEALGRGSRTANNGYDNTAWWKTDANTPTGDWTARVDVAGTPTSSYGPYERVRMTAIAGIGDHADVACNTYGRFGFLIHGGDPETNTSTTWYPLRPTQGCIRVSNENQQTIIDTIKALGGDGKVFVKGPQ